MPDKWFKNTFAPNARTKILSTNQIIMLLFHRVALYEDLPEDARIAVDAEMEKRNSSINTTVEDE